MDFKARFAGKTSKITKDGEVEGRAAEFDRPQNQPVPAPRTNSIHKNDRIQQSNPTGGNA